LSFARVPHFFSVVTSLCSSATQVSSTTTCALDDDLSLSGDNVVLSDGNILADAAESAWGVVELLRGVDAFTHRQRVRIVVELHLVLAGLAVVDSADTGVLLVEPRALHVRLLLGVVLLGVNLAHQV